MSACLIFAICVSAASAQQVGAAASGRISGTTSSKAAGLIARGTGGERAGSSGFGTAEEQARVVAGKVAGYGAHPALGTTGESMFSGKGSGFGSGGDFAPGDFVGTMPGPKLGAASPALSSLPGSGFGISLTAGGGSGGRSGLTTASHSSASTRGAKPQIKDPDSILHPFTHSIGGGIGSMPGSLPTVLGAGSSH